MTNGRATGRAPRKDARRNYDRLLTAARAAFGEQGVGTSLNDIARRAGVGNVTLYRHFPTRQALLEALLGESLRGLRVRSDALLTAAMPGDALARWFEAAVEHAMTYRGLVDALVDSLADPESDLHASCQAMKAGGAQLLRAPSRPEPSGRTSTTPRSSRSSRRSPGPWNEHLGTASRSWPSCSTGSAPLRDPYAVAAAPQDEIRIGSCL